MSPGVLPFLTPERALIFRITHAANVPWILDKGLHCANSNVRDPNFVAIGNPDLIGKRARKAVAVGPGGTLSDYVPFYFTPRTPMLYNITSGFGGMKQTPATDIVILVASLRRLTEAKVTFLITDRHAYVQTAEYGSELEFLDRLDWERWRDSDFKIRPDDPARFDRYQAEALIHRHLPTALLDALVCYGAAQQGLLTSAVRERGLDLPVRPQPDWYC